MTANSGKFLLCAASAACLLALSACGTAPADGSAAPRTGAKASSAKMSPGDSMLGKALAEAEAADPQQGLQMLDEIYRANAQNPVVASHYARALREDEQFNKARMVLAPFSEEGREHPDALTELAKVHLALGNYKEAELVARQAIEIAPKSGNAFLALGTALDAQGYHEQAEVAFRRGTDYWEGDPAPILNNLALNLASQNKLEEALSILRRAKSISPDRIEIERNLRIISTLYETSGTRAPVPSRKPRYAGVREPAQKIAPSAGEVEHKEPVKAGAVDREDLDASDRAAPAAPASKPSLKPSLND